MKLSKIATLGLCLLLMSSTGCQHNEVLKEPNTEASKPKSKPTSPANDVLGAIELSMDAYHKIPVSEESK